MPAATIIRVVTVEPLDLPLYEPFTITTGTFLAANNVVARVELESGVTGLGEASPSLSSGGETQATVLAAARAMAEILPGRDAARWRELAEMLLANFEAHSCARAAVEMALLDALTRAYQIPLWQWFGGASSQVRTDLTIPIVAVEHARAKAAEIAARGIQAIKIKVGGDMAEDEARVVAIHEGAPACSLQLDGNQAYDPPGALRLLARLERRGVVPTLFEQPVHRFDWAGLVEMTARSPVPIAADESIHTPADALRAAREHAAHVINIKLMKSTLLGALDIVAICRASRMGIMIGAMMESRLATAVSAHFAAGMGGFGFIDLDTPMLIDGDPFTGGYAQTGGLYDLAIADAGHGVAWKEEG